MTQIILIIVGVAIVAVLLSRKTREKVVGICASALGQDARKRENKEKILAFLGGRSEASNSDIREAVGVSDRSVIRYLDEMEKEGKVEQVGRTGRGVIYRIKA